MYGGFAYGELPYGGLSAQEDNRVATAAQWGIAIRFTVGAETYAKATDDILLDGTEYEQGLVEATNLSPIEAMPEDFGLVDPASPRAGIFDDSSHTFRDLMNNNNLAGVSVLVTAFNILTLEDGNTKTLRHKRTYNIEEVEFSQGVLTLELKGIEDMSLDQEFPARTYNTTDFPGIHEEHEGLPVPIVFGLGIKVPGVYLDNGAGSGPWQIAFCLEGPPLVDASGSDDGFLSVYRDGRIVPTSEYTLKTIASQDASYSVVVAEFAQQQLRQDLSLYQFAADIRDTTTRTANPVTEAAFLLTEAGLTVEAQSQTSAQDYCDNLALQCGGVYGHNGTRTFRGYLDDLAMIGRFGLIRSPGGEYRFIQHKPLNSVRGSYSAEQMDLVEVGSWRKRAKHTSLAVRWGTSPRNVDDLRHTTRRNVSGGTQGDEKPFPLRYVQDFNTADRVAAFLVAREEHNGEADVRVGFASYVPQQVVSIASAQHWSGFQLLRVASVEHVPAGTSFKAREYSDALFDYTAGTPPSDVTQGYEPDYTHTPPAAPTNLTVVAAGTFVAEDGTVRAWMELSADEPAVNFQYLEFQLRNTSDNTLIIEKASDDNDDGTWTFKFPNLNPSITYEWHAYAVNPENAVGSQKGVVAAQNINTAQAAAPNAPTGLTATAKSGRTELTWTNPSNDDVNEIEIHRSTTNGFTPDATTLIAEEAGESHKDITGVPGTLYYYKVKAVSTSELTSAASSQVSATFKGVTGDGVSQDAPASLAGITMAIGSSETYQDAQGNSFARVRLDLSSIPTDTLRSFIQIKHRKGTTGNYRLDDQVAPGSGSVSVWIDDLLPNIAYDFAAAPISHFGVAGTVKNISATTPKDSTAPSAPTGLDVLQGSARQMSVTWDENSENDILDYELQEKIGTGSFNTIYQGKATGKTVRISTYTQRTYRVRARDTSKNDGGWSSEVTETPDKNIDYRDIPSGGVRRDSVETDAIDTDRRDGVGIVSVSTGSSSSPGVSKGSGSISSPKTPLTSMKGIYVGTKVACDEMHSITSASTSSVSVWNIGLDCRNGMSIDVFYF